MPRKDTNIGWCDDTWNPHHGCFKCSEGCANCFAAGMSQRFGHTDEPWTVDNASENVREQRHHLDYPRGKDPRRIFVNSMSDLFLPEEIDGEPLLTDGHLHDIFDRMVEADQHVFQALTKHGTENGRLREWSRWPDNLWMGVSVENAGRTYRIDHLRETGAAVKWVSFEPLLGPVGDVDLSGIDWAVVGGESGPDYREMDHAWAREIRDQCREQGVALFFKQSASRQPERGCELAEEHRDYETAIAEGGETTAYREFPDAFTPELAAERPDLTEQVKA